MSAKHKAVPAKPEPKQCPSICLTAVAEVYRRTEQERQLVLEQARQASGLPEGKWNLSLESGMWTPEQDAE